MGFRLARLKSRIPAPLLQAYHFVLVHLAAIWYRFPSRELVVIGVTGTNGKTTTSYLIAKALEASGFPTGCTTTALIKIGEREWLNRTKMTMPGRFFLQRTLRQMVRAGCRYAVIETSSQGITQFRHLGLEYDVAVFTNLTPEHLESHGGFENYQQAKRKLFAALSKHPAKRIGGQLIPRVAIINADSPYADFYASTPGVPSVAWYGLKNARGLTPTQVVVQANGSSFHVKGIPVELSLVGAYNVENALAALAVCEVFGVDLAAAAKHLSMVIGVPGRFERVNLGQPWTVIIDYAYEPEALKKVYEAVRLIPHQRLIHVVGGCGGGRDQARRDVTGRLAAEQADLVIVTNEDPYDDPPQTILDQVAAGAIAGGKTLGVSLWKILDRKEAIITAMKMAKPQDLVLLTGKGCEPWICVAHGGKIPWNERAAAEAGIRYATSH